MSSGRFRAALGTAGLCVLVAVCLALLQSRQASERPAEDTAPARREALPASGRASVTPAVIGRAAGQEAPSARPAQPVAAPLSPEGAAALRQGVAALGQGQDGEAVRWLERAARSDPQSALVRDYLGIAYQKQRRFDAALKQFREECRLEPRSAIGWARIASVYEAQHKLEQAIQALERAVQLDRDEPQLHYNLGVLLQRHRQLSRAVASLQRAVELDPRNHEYRFLLGSLLFQTVGLDAAEREIERAIALKPDVGAYHFTLGKLLLRRRATPETGARALRQLDRALALGVPRPAEAQYYRGLCLQRLGRWEDSLPALQAALQHEPEHMAAHQALAVSYSRLGRAAEARASLARFRELRVERSRQSRRSAFEQAVARDPEDADIRYQLGVFLHSEGDLVGAVKALKQAAALAGRQKAPPKTRLRIHRRLEALYRQAGLHREAAAERAQVRRLERGQGS